MHQETDIKYKTIFKRYWKEGIEPKASMMKRWSADLHKKERCKTQLRTQKKIFVVLTHAHRQTDTHMKISIQIYHTINHSDTHTHIHA